MKKFKILLISLISMFALSINIYAASGSLSVSSGSVYVGDSFTVTVNVSSAAAWNVHVVSSGPVSGCTINQADATADAMDTNKSFSATCTATGEGTISVRLSGDVTSASDGNAVGISGSSNVSVVARPAPPSDNGNNNSSGNNNTNNNSRNNTNTNNTNINQVTDNKSSNNNLKELSIDGYQLVKADANNYTLEVPNDVTSIKINATSEDSKAKVTGIGNHDIKVGENNIEVTVTAENGSENRINIKVTRKDGYYLEDLESALKKDNVDDLNITIKSDTILTIQDLEKIKNSKKTVKFNCYDNDKNLLYSWTIDGSKIKDTSDFITTIVNDSENKKDILRLSNYADGMFFELREKKNIPKKSKIKLFVGNKYENDSLVNVYVYIKNNNKLKLVNNNLKVENGYIEFYATNASDYFVTMSNIPNSDKVTSMKDKSSLYIVKVVIGILVLSVIGLFIVFIIKNKKKNDINNNIN